MAVVAALLTCVTCAGAALAPSAAAQSTGRWAFEPSSATGDAVNRSSFDYTLSAGSAVQDFVRLSNGTDHDMTFTIYAADAYTTAQGAFALRLRDQPRSGVGAWVSLPFTTRTVAAGTVATFPFQLGVPAGIAPGDWAGGIVAVASTTSGSGPSNGLTIEQGSGVRVYVRVKGTLHPSLAVTRFDSAWSGGAWSPVAGSGTATFTYAVANDGNVRLGGTAQLEVADAFGHTVKRFEPRHLPELLPGDTTTVTETWDGLPNLGVRLRPRLVVQAPDVEVVRQSAPVWHVPVPINLGVLAVLALLTFATRALFRLRRRRVAVPRPAAIA